MKLSTATLIIFIAASIILAYPRIIRVGHFARFQSESDLRHYLESNLEIDVATYEQTFTFMQDKLKYRGEFCLEEDYSVVCYVNAEMIGFYGVWKYEIKFRFAEDVLSEIEIEMRWYGL